MIIRHLNRACRKYILPPLRRILERRWFDVGLRAKMGSVVLVGLAGLIGVFALLGISTARQTTRQVLQDRMMLAQLGATSLDATLRHIRSDLDILADTQTLSDPTSTVQECGNTIRQLAFMTEGILLLNRQGHMVSSVFCKTVPEETAEILRTFDWSSLPAVQNVMNGNHATISIIPLETHETPGGAHPWAILSVPVYDERDNLVRILGGLLDLSNPDLFAIQTPFGLQGSLDIVNTNGLVLISTHPERVLTTSDPEEILGKVFRADQPRVATCLGCDGSQPEGQRRGNRLCAVDRSRLGRTGSAASYRNLCTGTPPDAANANFWKSRHPGRARFGMGNYEQCHQSGAAVNGSSQAYLGR